LSETTGLDQVAAPGTLVLLIRHGETQWNLDQRMQGHLDVPLTERGAEQARQLARWLEPEPPEVVYTSDLQRSRRTAEILAGQAAEVTIDPRLREACFGEWEGLTRAECAARFPEVHAAWRRDALRNRPPGGETIEDLQARCMAALRDVLPRHPARRVAVVSHGGPIRAMVCGLLSLPLSVYPRLRVENTGVTRILFGERGAILAGYNDVSHLRATSAAPKHTGWEEK
jgi:broad specificity phosphatase PhoE